MKNNRKTTKIWLELKKFYVKRNANRKERTSNFIATMILMPT